MQNQPTTQTDLTFKQKCAWLVALCALCSLLLAGALYPVFQQRAEAEKQRVALAQKEQTENAAKAKISAAKAVKIKAKRKGKMEKIALGQTKTINLTGFVFGAGDTLPSPNGDNGVFRANSAPTPNGTKATTKIRATWDYFGDTGGDPGTVAVTIVVDNDAAMGVIPFSIYSPDTNSDGQLWKWSGQIEIVCIEKITITKEKID